MAKYREIFELPQRLYAIGDIHACLNETDLLLNFLEQEERLNSNDQVIFIGDYVDRGSESKSVIQRLIEFRKKFPATIFLRGNHEDMLLNFLGFEGSEGDSYIQNGGADFISSYGLLNAPTKDEIIAGIPADHLSFLLGTEYYVICGDFVFAHAGLHPLRPLEAQITNHLFWIRDEFINNIHRFEKTIVFGHTPYQNVMFHLPYKIGIDTGLVYGNLLSCIELTQKKIFQIRRGYDEVMSAAFPG